MGASTSISRADNDTQQPFYFILPFRGANVSVESPVRHFSNDPPEAISSIDNLLSYYIRNTVSWAMKCVSFTSKMHRWIEKAASSDT